jgi:transcriptional regulator with XRE-family HTH domain
LIGITIIGSKLPIIVIPYFLFVNNYWNYNSSKQSAGGSIMLIFDMRAIGNKLLAIRRRMGMTQAEVAEAAGLSDRTYADIERGTVNTRTETILRICNVLHITPDEILTEDHDTVAPMQNEVWDRLNACNPKDKQTALQLLSVFLKSLDN